MIKLFLSRKTAITLQEQKNSYYTTRTEKQPSQYKNRKTAITIHYKNRKTAITLQEQKNSYHTTRTEKQPSHYKNRKTAITLQEQNF